MRARVFGLVLAVLGSASPAVAAPDEVIVAAEPGYQRRFVDPDGQDAAGATLAVWWGLSETLWLSASAGGFRGLQSNVGLPPQARAEFFGGIVAALDVFRVVPYLQCDFGLVVDEASAAATVRLGVGADYLLSPQWALGAVLRYQPLPDEDFGSGTLTPQLRLSYRFEG